MNSENLASAISGIKGLRKVVKGKIVLSDLTKEQIKTSSNIFYSYLKKYNYQFFYKDFLISFINDEVPKEYKRYIVKAILSELVNKKLIVLEVVEVVRKPFLRNRVLSCADSDSYKILMNKNGYSFIDFYKWGFDNIRKIPKRILVDTQKIGIDSKKDFDFSVLRETKPKHRQGVFSNRKTSVTLTKGLNPKSRFKVL
jgi:hypothetical protein